VTITLPNSTDRRSYLLALSIGVTAVVVRGLVAWRTHSTGEDALITLRYAEHIAAGHGFVFNLGERVFGSTTPLYTLLLALFAALHLDALAWGKAINILADGATCVLLTRLPDRLGIARPQVGLFAALLYALTSTPISVSIGGMETGLVTCVSLGMITAYVCGNSRTLYVLGALLYLLRIDGLLLFGILAMGLTVRQRRIVWQDFAWALLIALPWTLFATFYFGSPIPTSLIAKVTAYSQGGRVPLTSLHPMAANLAAFITQFAQGIAQKALSLLMLVGIGNVLKQVGMRFRRSKEAQEPIPDFGPGLLMLPTAWMLLYYTAMLTSRVPAFGWYFLPPWPLVMTLAALGADSLITLLQRPTLAAARSGRMPLLWSLLLACSGLLGLLHLPVIAREIALRQRQDESLRLPIGLWLRAHAQSQERVLLEPIGYIGYYSRLPLLDSIGLVSPEVLPSYRTLDPLADMIARLHPEWLCLREAEAASLGLQGDTVSNGRYILIRTFRSTSADTVFRLYHRRDPEPAHVPSR
jgi:hypothetical protein